MCGEMRDELVCFLGRRDVWPLRYVRECKMRVHVVEVEGDVATKPQNHCVIWHGCESHFWSYRSTRGE